MKKIKYLMTALIQVRIDQYFDISKIIQLELRSY